MRSIRSFSILMSRLALVSLDLRRPEELATSKLLMFRPISKLSSHAVPKVRVATEPRKASKLEHSYQTVQQSFSTNENAGSDALQVGLDKPKLPAATATWFSCLRVNRTQ